VAPGQSGKTKVHHKLFRVASTSRYDVPNVLHQPSAAPCCRTVQLLKQKLLSMSHVRVPAMHANKRISEAGSLSFSCAAARPHLCQPIINCKQGSWWFLDLVQRPQGALKATGDTHALWYQHAARFCAVEGDWLRLCCPDQLRSLHTCCCSVRPKRTTASLSSIQLHDQQGTAKSWPVRPCGISKQQLGF
jgi:hypothetical protein